MNFFLIRYLIPLVGIAAIVLGWKRRQNRELGTGLFLLWSLFWIGLSVVVQLPQKTDVLARVLGVGRGVDVLLFLAVIAIFFIQFRLFLRMERMERDITKMVRREALRGVESHRDNHP